MRSALTILVVGFALAPEIVARAQVIPTTRTIDGVVVRNHRSDALEKAPRWSLSPRPMTVIGGASGDPKFDLTYAGDFALLSDGRMVTLAPIGNRLFVFATEPLVRTSVL